VAWFNSRRFAQAGLSAAVVVFLVSLAIVIAGSMSGSGTGSGRFTAEPGAVARPFRLPDLDARVLSLEDFRGRVVLMCVTNPDPQSAGAILPRLHDAVEPFADDGRVATVTVFRTESLPGSPELAQLRMDLSAAGLYCPTLLDVTSDFSRQYRTSRGTSLFVIDGAGVIRYRSDDADDRPDAFTDAREAVAALLDVPLARTPGIPPLLAAAIATR
jgi:hypothetical protein